MHEQPGNRFQFSLASLFVVMGGVAFAVWMMTDSAASGVVAIVGAVGSAVAGARQKLREMRDCSWSDEDDR